MFTLFDRSNAVKYDIVVPGIVSQRREVPEHIIKPEYWLNGVPPVPPSKPEIKTKQQIEMMKISCGLAGKILRSLKGIIKVI